MKNIPIQNQQFIGAEYNQNVVKDSEFFKITANNDLITSKGLFYEIENFLVQKIKKKIRKSKQYISTIDFYKLLQNYAQKYLQYEAVTIFSYDLNSKRIVIEIALDVYRMTLSHSKYEKDQQKEIITNGYNFLKILLQSNLYPSV